VGLTKSYHFYYKFGVEAEAAKNKTRAKAACIKYVVAVEAQSQSAGRWNLRSGEVKVSVIKATL